MKKLSSNKPRQKMTWLVLALSVISLSGCARNSAILAESDIVYLIPAGTQFTAKYDCGVKNYTAEQDRYVVAKGNYFNLVRCCDNVTK